MAEDIAEVIPAAEAATAAHHLAAVAEPRAEEATVVHLAAEPAVRIEAILVELRFRDHIVQVEVRLILTDIPAIRGRIIIIQEVHIVEDQMFLLQPQCRQMPGVLPILLRSAQEIIVRRP
jgi:hypothetical protein